MAEVFKIKLGAWVSMGNLREKKNFVNSVALPHEPPSGLECGFPVTNCIRRVTA